MTHKLKKVKHLYFTKTKFFTETEMSQKQIGHKKTEMDSSRSSLQRSSGGFSTQFISRSVWSGVVVLTDLTLASRGTTSDAEVEISSFRTILYCAVLLTDPV